MNQAIDSERAFTDLVDRLLDRVYRYLRNLTRDEDDARALCHETFLKLRRRLELGQEPSEAYVFAAARNTALSEWRRRKGNPVRPAGDPLSSEQVPNLMPYGQSTSAIFGFPATATDAGLRLSGYVTLLIALLLLSSSALRRRAAHGLST